VRLVLDGLVADVQARAVNPVQAERAMRGIRPDEEAEVLELGHEAEVLLQDGRWQEALLRSRLLVAGLSNVDMISPLGRLRADIALLFVDATRESLSRGNDPDGFAAARRAGEWALDWARTHHDDRVAGTASFRLGTLHLEPYTRFRGPEAVSLDQLSWARRGRADAVDRTVHEGFMVLGDDTPVAPPGLPAPSVALTTAAGHFRTAAQLRTGEARGEVYRRLANTLIAMRMLEEPIDERELTDATTSALRLMPADAYSARMQLLIHLPTDGALEEARTAADALERDTAGYIDATDADHAVLAATGAAQLLAETDPRRALALVRRVRRIAGRDCVNAYLLRSLSTEADLLPRAVAPEWLVPESPVPVDTLTDCPPEEAVGRLVACAAWAYEHDAAEFGLAALAAIPESDDDDLHAVSSYLSAQPPHRRVGR
jgi:hypothetical protein